MTTRQDGVALPLSLIETGNSQRPLSLALVGLWLRLGDCILAALSGALLYLAYVGPDHLFANGSYVWAIAGGSLAVICGLHWCGAYGRKHFFSAIPPVGRIVTGLGVAFSILLGLAFLAKATDSYSRVWALSWFASLLILSVGFHAMAQAHFRRLAARGRFAYRTVILGTGEPGRQLARHLLQYADPSVEVVGFIDDRQSRVPPYIDDFPVLGGTSKLLEMVRRDLVDQVFVALPWAAVSRIGEVVDSIAESPVRVLLAPDLIGHRFLDRSFEQFSRLSVLRLHDRPISEGNHIVKELEDRVLSALLLFFLAPLFAAVAVWIKLDSPGPVFFKQVRQGFNNQEILVWKFRTMYRDQTDIDCERQTTADDPRVTPVGRFLRRSSIDELPQLLNVLFGSMSLVGPRPHALQTKADGHRFEEVVDRYVARHRVKPGITGWAQVNGWRGETDTVEKIQQRVQHDLYYIENWSLRLDLSILLRTAFVVLGDRNAY